MKRFIYLFVILIFVATMAMAVNETAGVKKAVYYSIDKENLNVAHTGSANRTFMDDIVSIGNSSYDHYPCSYNNWGMGYEASRDLTYIVFTDCDQINGVDWDDITTFDRIIAYNVIDADGNAMLSPEGEAEPTYAGYPDMITAVNGRPYVAFHKNDGGYYPWIKGDQYNLGGTQVIWHDKVHPDFNSDWIWPQLRITRPTDNTEGVIYMMGTESTGDNEGAQVAKLVPQIDLNGWLADPFYNFENVQQVIADDESILHPSLAVSDDGSVVGLIYTTGEAATAAVKYTYSTDEGATWNTPIELAFDNAECDVDSDGAIDGNWSVSGTGMHLFFNANNEPLLSYIKNVTSAGGRYYPFTSKVFLGKIDIDNAELTEIRVSDVIDDDDITGGCCGPNASSIAARVSTYGGGQYIFIAWIDARDNLNEDCSNAEIYYSYSDDWGETWSQDVNISSTQTGGDDKDEVWLSVTPQIKRDADTGTAVLSMMFMWDESPGNSVSDDDNPGEITMNEIFFYEYDTGVPLAIEDDFKLVSKSNFKLNQNKPNPFNPTTTMSFELSKADDVKVSVYNIKGELVNVIADGYYNTGSHTLVWDGKDSSSNSVASGVYFYTMETSTSSATKKMILMK